MSVIKNYDSLNINEKRKVALELIDTAFSSILPEEIFKKFSYQENKLTIQDKEFDLSNFERISLIGLGKGSAEMCRIVEEKLGDRLTQGFDIDVVDEAPMQKVAYTKGTHPLPSQINIDYTNKVLNAMQGRTEKDLVLVVICGGGSAMFESPANLTLERLDKVFSDMLKSGADITEMNIVRKHVSKVKGGGLAHLLYPATVVSLIFSDVPGNDLSTIASGPTVKDIHTLEDTKAVLSKYNLQNDLEDADFSPTPTDDKYFTTVHNVLMLSNLTAIQAMQKKAEDLGFTARMWTDRLQGDARVTGEKLINEAKSGEVLLAGGETTIKISGRGLGGRNQALALCSLPFIDDQTLLVSFSTDGWDFYWFAGAMVDSDTKKKITEMHIDTQEYLADDNSYGFFERIGDGIQTGKQESNVSDLYIVIKK